MAHGELTLSVPADKAEEVGMRPPIDEDDVEDLFELLGKKDVREPANWSRRFKNHQEKLKSGDVYQVAEVVRNLALREQSKGLSAGEKSMLEKSRQVLVSELAISMNVTEDEALDRVTATLSGGTGLSQGPPRTSHGSPLAGRQEWVAMTGTAQEILRFGRERLRVSPHVSDETLAHLAPFPSGAPVSTNAVSYVTSELGQRGFRAVVTERAPARRPAVLPESRVRRAGAPPPADTVAAVGAGTAEPAHTAGLAPRPFTGAANRQGRLRRVLATRRSGPDDALHATPSATLRILTGSEGPAGYTVSGRAGPTGYLQRLAVDPRWHGRGYGRALVTDSLRWMHRRGARAAVVNTQDVNHVALALYRSAGFVEEPTGLDVLVFELYDAGVPAPVVRTR